MNRSAFLLFCALSTGTLIGQTTYTQTLPNMESVYQWRDFTFTDATATTGPATLTFQWLACWQQVFGGSSSIRIELETAPGDFTQVYYETGNVSECAFFTRTANLSATEIADAIATGGGSVNGRVRIDDACYPGVGCSFYNDPLVYGLTLTYETHAANFTAVEPSICPGSNVQFTDASINTPTSYEWIFPGGEPATSAQQNPTVQYAVSGSYDVTLIVVTADGPDTLLKPAFVTVYPLPLANAGVDETVCAGGTTQLQASGGVGYQWFPATGLDDDLIADPEATPLTNTVYTVLVTSAQGCQASDFMVLTVQPLPTVAASAGNNTICLGDTAYIVATGAQLYQWSPNLFISGTSGAAQFAWPTSTFTWTVVGTDLFGCENDTTITLAVEPPPPAPVVSLNGPQVTTSLASGYQWYVNGSPIPGATQQSWTPTVNGNYSVAITDANGCSSQSLPVYYGTVGVGERDTSVLTVRPQPVEDLLVVQGISARTSARLMDARGRAVWSGTLHPGGTSTLDMRSFGAGLYVLEILEGPQRGQLPVIKK